MIGLDLASWSLLRAESTAGAATKGDSADAKPLAGLGVKNPASRCILIWLDGGPSHLDTFDPKPDAPSEVRGPFASIATGVDGLRVSELMPGTAKHARKLAVIRSMTSPLGEHNFGSHYLLTGFKPSPALRYPSIGAVVSDGRRDGR